MLELRAYVMQIAVSLGIKRGVMFGSVLLLMGFFAANGVNVLTKGKIGSPRRVLLQSGKGLSSLSRFALASVYLVAASSLALLVWKWRMWRFR
jgi:hypothetical protein